MDKNQIDRQGLETTAHINVCSELALIPSLRNNIDEQIIKPSFNLSFCVMTIFAKKIASFNLFFYEYGLLLMKMDVFYFITK